MTITIYGIKSCNSMKKTFSKLDELGVSYDFHDYKKQGIDKDNVQRWVDSLGMDKVLNKRGTTWRKLSDEQKAAAESDESAAIELLMDNTSMIKRPVIDGEFQGAPVLICGFDEEVLNSTFDKAS